MTARFLARRLSAGALVLLGLTACGDGTAPVAPENLPLQAADVTEIAARLDSVSAQPILDMLRYSDAPLLRAARTSHDLARASATSPSPSPASVRPSLDIQRARIARQVTGGEPVVDPFVRGLTFVWGVDGWTIDTLANGEPRPGAPSNGVRVRLYALDQYTSQPVGPSLGYLEIVDNSTTSATRYTVRVVANAGLVVVQYNTVASGMDETSFAISQTGFVTDGVRRIEQSFVMSPTEVRASWSAPFAGVSMEFVLGTSATAGTANLRWTLTTPRGSIRFVINSSVDGGSARIYANGALWAQQSWTGDEGISEFGWEKPDGSPIEESDLIALEESMFFMDGFSTGNVMDSNVFDLLQMASFGA